MAKDEKIVIAVSQGLKSRLVDFAARQDRTYGFVCRRAIERYIGDKDEVE